MEHQGFLLIADITGYTTYLNRSELEHAQGTLTDLLELLIAQTRPPFVVSQLEGDAVLSYGLSEKIGMGQTFLESVEHIYLKFRQAIDLMVLNNTCQCAACANVSTLDLKFFVHRGSFALQKLGDTEQLVGSDVNLIHRLLKNTVTSSTGFVAYLLLTNEAYEALGIADIEGSTMHREQVDDFGDVDVWIRDMHPVLDSQREGDDIAFSAGEIYGTVSTEIALPPEVVWDYASRPDHRRLLTRADKMETTELVGGRVAPGTIFQCFHGQAIAPQIVIEWRPFERMVVKQLLPLPGRQAVYAHLDLRFTTSGDGTRLDNSIARLEGPALKRALARLAIRANQAKARSDLEAFRDAIEAADAA